MIDLRVRLAFVGLLTGLTAAPSIAGDEERLDIEVTQVVENAVLYQADPVKDLSAEADSVLEALALEQDGKLLESVMNSYGQLVSELEMYDDGTRMVETTSTEQGESRRTRANFLPSS